MDGRMFDGMAKGLLILGAAGGAIGAILFGIIAKVLSEHLTIGWR